MEEAVSISDDILEVGEEDGRNSAIDQSGMNQQKNWARGGKEIQHVELTMQSSLVVLETIIEFTKKTSQTYSLSPVVSILEGKIEHIEENLKLLMIPQRREKFVYWGCPGHDGIGR